MGVFVCVCVCMNVCDIDFMRLDCSILRAIAENKCARIGQTR